MSFHAGQQVVCIKSTPSCSIECGRIYTIKQVIIGKRLTGVTLFEAAPSAGYDGFLASRFRPLRDTDISIFTAMLNKSPEAVS